MAVQLMPCGHPSRLVGGRVLVCSVDCDLRIVETDGRPRCERCGSASLVRHDFGSDAFGQWHNQTLPNAVRCEKCDHVMHYGGKKP